MRSGTKLSSNVFQDEAAASNFNVFSNKSTSTAATRRHALHQATLASLVGFISATGTSLTAMPLPVSAKEIVPVTREMVAASFQAVRDELEAPNGGIKSLEDLVAKEDFAGLMDFTKGYDLEFRKAKMGKARKFITSKEGKDRAVLLCNAVTFDLIGMNKGSREGQKDIQQVKKYFEELKKDIASFLELEKGIEFAN
jgi:hypothetical protein